jgi:hypothetical protein
MSRDHSMWCAGQEQLPVSSERCAAKSGRDPDNGHGIRTLTGSTDMDSSRELFYKTFVRPYIDTSRIYYHAPGNSWTRPARMGRNRAGIGRPHQGDLRALPAFRPDAAGA